MPERQKILLVGQTPPPYHGQAVATKLLFDHDWTGLQVFRLRMAYSEGEDEVGRFSVQKLLHLVSLIFKSWRILLRHRSCYLYYPPASPNLIPVLRDIVFLFAVRPFSRGVILHYHAGGLPAYIASLNPVLRFLAGCAYGKAKASIEIARSKMGPGVAFAAQNKFHVANGLDVPSIATEKGRSPDESTFRIFFMAGLRATKGVMEIVKTASEMKLRGIDCIFDIAGPWQEEDTRLSFEQAVLEADVADCIVMHGRVTGEDKWNLYKKASLFFFPSYYESENFPLVLIEAMAFGLPIVATRWRGIPEMVLDNETGILCDVNSPVQFADGIEKLNSSEDLMDTMSNAANARYTSNYTQNSFLKNIQIVFDSVTGKECGKS